MGERPGASRDIASLLESVAAAQRSITDAEARDALDIAAGYAKAMVDADLVLVGTIEGRDVLARAAAGGHDKPVRVGDTIRRKGSLTGQVLLTGQPVLCLDAFRDPRTDAEHNRRIGMRSSAIVPLLRGGVPVGIIAALSSRTAAFDEQDLQILALLAGTASTRLAQALASERSARISERLADQERLYGTVFDSLDEGILVHAPPDGAIVRANAAALRILGVPLEQLLGRIRLDAQTVALHEDGSPWSVDSPPAAEVLRTGEAVRDQTMGIRLPDGSPRWLTVTALPVLDVLTGALTNVVTTFRDVTVEREARRTMVDSARRTRAAQELVGLAWWRYDVDTDTHEWSDQMFRLLGLEPGGRAPGLDGYLSFVHPEDRDRSRRPCSDSAVRRNSHDDVFRVMRVDGEVRTLQAWSEEAIDETGRVTSVTGATLDITERELAAAALSEQARRWQAAASVSGLATWNIDLVTGQLTWSPEMYQTFGIPADEVVDVKVHRGLVHPDDWPELQRISQQVLTDGTPRRTVTRIRRRSGEERTLWAWTDITHDSSGAPLRLWGVTLDVTDLQVATRSLADREEQFRIAFDNAPIGMSMMGVAADNAGKLLRVNDSLCSLLGYDPASLLSLRMSDWTHPDDVGRDQSRLRRFFDGDIASVAYSKRYRHREGRTIHAWVTSAITCDDNGRPLYLISHVVDVTERERATRELEESQRRLAAAQEVTGLAWWERDRRTGVRAWSDGMHHLVGRDPCDGAPSPQEWTALVHPDDRETLEALDERAVREGVGYRHVFRVVLGDGQVRHLQSWSEPVPDEDGQVRTLRGATLDVTSREETARAVAASEQQFRVAFDNAPTGMTMVSLAPGREGRILRANEAFCAMLGRGEDDVLGRSVLDWTHPGSEGVDGVMLRRLATGEVASASFEKRYLHTDGHEVHAWVNTAVAGVDDAGHPYLITHVLDVTERREQQQELERLALTDTLTGLANRTLLEDRVRHALARQQRGSTVVALLLLDLDRFKLVNDSLGHQVGDALLVEVAHRLQSVSRRDCTVARLGGDEFVVLVEDARDVAEVEVTARRVLEALRGPYLLPSGETLVVTSSLGLAASVDGGRDADELFREADLALYRAKDTGRDRMAMFDAELRSRAVARVSTEQQLRRALAQGGLCVHLQPVVELEGGGPRTAEALVRLLDPELGLVPPGDFIEVAEDCGLIVDVDAWVLERAVDLLADGADGGGDGGVPERIAVNVSGRTLERAGFAATVRSALARRQVDPSRLLIELTETTLLTGSAVVAQTLADLHALGTPIGIDDFGTGFSALAYLQRFELDFLKIDRSFVARLGTGPRPDAVVAAIIALAHAHDLTVTAEGVETSAQADALRAMGCDAGQGWLFGRPVAP